MIYFVSLQYDSVIMMYYKDKIVIIDPRYIVFPDLTKTEMLPTKRLSEIPYVLTVNH